MPEDMERARGRVVAAYEAFNRGDFDAAAEHLHPEVQWNRVAEFEQAVSGRERVRSMFEPEVWASQRTEIHRAEVIGECVLLDTTFHGKGMASGIELDQGGYHLWRIEDGKGREFTFFEDRDEAIAAAEELAT
jgi:ketosteroid isomerase-like protein